MSTNVSAARGPAAESLGPRQRWRSLPRVVARNDGLALVGVAVLICIVAVAVLAPWVAPYPTDGTLATNPTNALAPPSPEHWLGTDQVGRDVLSRVIFGARTSLFIAVAVITIAASIGVTLGVVAGFMGGWVRDVIMRVTDIFLAFPAMLLSLVFALIMGPSVKTAIIAIAITWWPWYTRLSASVASSVRSRGYIDAAICLGVPRRRIVLRHVLPNSVTPVIVQLSLDAGGVILTAAALSFLGLGAQEPIAEWGLMVQEGQSLFSTSWWVASAPGCAILVTAFCFNVIGEGLRHALDPRGSTR